MQLRYNLDASLISRLRVISIDQTLDSKIYKLTLVLSLLCKAISCIAKLPSIKDKSIGTYCLKPFRLRKIRSRLTAWYSHTYPTMYVFQVRISLFLYASLDEKEMAPSVLYVIQMQKLVWDMPSGERTEMLLSTRDG